MEIIVFIGSVIAQIFQMFLNVDTPIDGLNLMNMFVCLIILALIIATIRRFLETPNISVKGKSEGKT